MGWREFIDSNSDGVITLMDVLYYIRVAIYLFCAVWGTIHIQQFSDVQYLAVIAASFGASTFEVFLQSKILNRKLEKKQPESEAL